MPTNRGDRRRVWSNPSHSNPNKNYETILWTNGELTCNCGGWLYPRNGNPRTCRHVKNAEFEIRNNTQKRVRPEITKIPIHQILPEKQPDEIFTGVGNFKKYRRMIRIEN